MPESYSIYRSMNNQIWQNFFQGGKFTKNLENLNVGESIRCPLFLSTSIYKSVAIRFLHGVGGVFFKINMKKHHKVFLLSNNNSRYDTEYEILLPPNCDLIVRKLRYTNNETIGNRKYSKIRITQIIIMF